MNTRVIVHFNFKKGMEEKGVTIIEDELFEFLKKSGCQKSELFQDAENPSHYYYTADWNSVNDAKKIQKEWESKTKELHTYCTNHPKREIYITKSSLLAKAA